ncbi:FCD domain-containing protein [Halovulum dunhuangense]|uniref:FCD domain-containing protein n=1 Tax=Halovulum dunhuangense TaxID=1505036 RepID=A0A849L1L7_9RHOB|nr:FCD domain-containing protein [Halovulum dunhuangense]NNU80160.1 FCD domain-containing protein [Halovulum dunhuangense]
MDDDRGDLAILRSSSLTSALEKALEKLIIEGELAPGERLNEIQLSQRFGTSRGPLREATRSLEAKGFVEVIRNRGVFVRQLSIEEALEIYDLRGALFGLAGRIVSQKMTDELLQKLTALVRGMEEAAARGDFDSYYPINLEFHRAIIEASGNKALIEESTRFEKKMHLFRAKSLVQGGGLAVSNREHAEMLNALASGDPERAFNTHWRHVERAKSRMLAAMEDEERRGKEPPNKED